LTELKEQGVGWEQMAQQVNMQHQNQAYYQPQAQEQMDQQVDMHLDE
jgi:hypothetical protein